MNSREKIMNLVKEGIITTEEAIILIENNHREEQQSNNSLKQAESVEEQISVAKSELEMLESLEMIAPLTKEQQERLSELEDNIHGLKDKRDRVAFHEDGISYSKEKWKNFKEETIQQANDIVQQMGGYIKKTGNQVHNYLKEASDRQTESQTPKFLNKDYSFEHQDIEKIELEAVSANFNLKTWNESNVKIEVNAKIFTTSEDTEAFFLEKTILTIQENTLKIKCIDKNISSMMDIYVPQKNYHSINIKVGNGDIVTDSIRGIESSIYAIHGNVLLQQVDIQHMNLSITNGETKIKDSLIHQLMIENKNGNVQISGSFTTLKVKCINGNMMTHNYSKSIDEMNFQTINGNIKLWIQPRIPFAMTASTKLGKIHHNLLNFEILQDIHHRTGELLSGNIREHQVLIPAFVLNIESKTGNIEITQMKGEN